PVRTRVEPGGEVDHHVRARRDFLGDETVEGAGPSEDRPLGALMAEAPRACSRARYTATQRAVSEMSRRSGSVMKSVRRTGRSSPYRVYEPDALRRPRGFLQGEAHSSLA